MTTAQAMADLLDALGRIASCTCQRGAPDGCECVVCIAKDALRKHDWVTPPEEEELPTRDELLERIRGMTGRLTRIRVKADAAAGIDTKKIHTGRDECDLAGRAAGAEGAVDLLIAQLCGLKKEP